MQYKNQKKRYNLRIFVGIIMMNIMGALELRTKLVDIINSSDERFLRMVNALHKSYLNKQNTDFFTELPAEIQELLIESRKQARQGKTRIHKEVMADFREKYNISGRA